MRKKKYYRIPVIYFHSVAPLKNISWQNYFLTLELTLFERFLKYLNKRKYKTLFLDEYFERKKISNKREVVITFDDGYLDNWIYVFPLLKKYRIKATIFISPETVDKTNGRRPTLEKYWAGEIRYTKIKTLWGYMSWEELYEMERSGLVDVQSHTLTHTKYFISDKLIGFHFPGNKNIYPIWNVSPELKPYYIGNEEFNKRLPYGTPFFEEESAIIARKVNINKDFISEVLEILKGFDWKKVDEKKYFKIIQPIYDDYKRKGLIIKSVETEAEYKERVTNELFISKKEIESNLEKEVAYCCWPHGDNNLFAHETALQLGYKATTIGKYTGDIISEERIDERYGLKEFSWEILSIQHIKFNIRTYQKRFPQYQIKRLYHKLKYGIE